MSGLVNFEYPRPLSELREEFLVTYLENQDAAEVIRTRALLTAHLIPLHIPGKNIGKEVFDTFKDYSEILLPSNKKPVKIKDMDKTDLAGISKNLSDLRKLLIKTPKK